MIPVAVLGSWAFSLLYLELGLELWWLPVVGAFVVALTQLAASWRQRHRPG